jgi:hypothetical protein
MPPKKRSEAMKRRPCDAAGGFRNRLHAIGVRVSETRPDTSTAAVMTTANSCRRRPTTPPMNSTGMKTAASESVIDRIVKPISLAPISAASTRPLPSSMCRTMFSSITTASSTTKPTQRVSAISEMMSIV